MFVAVGNRGIIATSTDGITWTQATQDMGSATELRQVAFGGETFVAVGAALDSAGNRKGAVVFSSTDGATWTDRTPSAARAPILAVTYGNGRFVAVGYDSRTKTMTSLTSPDGVSWTESTSPVKDAEPRAVAFGGGLFVAVGYDNGAYETYSLILSSPDGVTWTRRASILWSGLFAITHGKGLFVATGYEEEDQYSQPYPMVLTSSDGTVWTHVPSPAPAAETDFRAVAFGNGVFVAVNYGLYAEAIYTSPDGTTWTRGTKTWTASPEAVAFGGGIFVAAGYGSLRSGDGTIWTESYSSVTDGSASLLAASYGNGSFVALGHETLNRVVAAVALTSTDGTTWTRQSVTNKPVPLRTGTFGGGTFLTMGKSEEGDGFFVFTSRDGAKWAESRLWSETDYYRPNLVAVTYGKGIFVATGSTGSWGGPTACTSPDGIKWTKRVTPDYEGQLNGVTYGNGLFVAVGYRYSFTANGDFVVILTSPDGVTWTEQDVSAHGVLWSVAYGNGVFVAVGGTSAAVFTSPDGKTWTERSWPLEGMHAPDAVTFGNGVFLGVGIYDTMAVSVDGVTWTRPNPQGMPMTLFSAAYGNNMFVAVGWEGGILQSGALDPYLSVTISGAGLGLVTSSPPGIDCGTVCGARYRKGTAVTLYASPKEGSTFRGWSGGGCSGTGACTVAMNDDVSVTAAFTTTVYTLSATVSGSGAISASGLTCIGTRCTGSYPSHTTVVLTAAPASGATFLSWTGCDTTSGTTCSVKMTSARSVTARFTALNPCTYRISPITRSFTAAGGSGSVTVTGSGARTCANPDIAVSDPSWLQATLTSFRGNTGSVKVTATKNTIASSRSGAVAVGDKVCDITQAAAPVYGLTAKIQGDGALSATGLTCENTVCSGVYTTGTAVVITATPGAGGAFISWSGCTSVDGLTCTVAMTAKKAVTARFYSVSCKYSLSSSTVSFSSAGGSSTVTVTATGGMNCVFPTVSPSDPSWIGAALPSFQDNRGSLKVTATKNPAITPRSGTVTVGGTVLTVNEAGLPCTLTLKPASYLFPSPAAGSSSFSVISPQGCGWTAAVATGGKWLSVTSGSPGKGDGTVGFSASVNTTGNQRSGSVKVSLTATPYTSKSFAVKQRR